VDVATSRSARIVQPSLLHGARPRWTATPIPPTTTTQSRTARA